MGGLGSAIAEVLSEADFNKLLEKTTKTRHRLAFKLAFLAGLRISEIIKLQPNDIDKSRKLIFIKQGKGSKDRYVPLPKFLTPKDIAEIPLSCGVRTLEAVFKRKLQKALGRKDLHFHNLRHSFATTMINKGMTLPDVQFWLGHSKLATTSIYLRVSPDAALKRYEELWR